MAKNNTSNFTVLLFSLVVSLLAAELVLRLVSPPEVNVHRLFCEHDPELGWRKIPGQSGWHEHPEYRVLEKMNSRGLRGPEYPLAKPAGQHRILVLGDSFAEGYTVGFDSLFSEVLEDSLRARCGGAVEVINAGTGGYSTDQELLFFENHGQHYQPDRTVLLFCSNDPWYNAQPRYWRGQKPLFQLAGDSLQLTNVPVPAPAERSFFAQTKGWALENLQLARYAKRAKGNLASQAGELPVEWEIYRRRPTPEMSHAWELTAALLARLQARTAAAGSELLVFYIPEKIEVYPAEWQRFLDTYQVTDADFAPAVPHTGLAAICDNLQIPLLEPTAAFRAAAGQGGPLYFQTDWHWNARGHALTGQLLADELGCPQNPTEQ